MLAGFVNIFFKCLRIGRFGVNWLNSIGRSKAEEEDLNNDKAEITDHQRPGQTRTSMTYDNVTLIEKGLLLLKGDDVKISS